MQMTFEDMQEELRDRLKTKRYEHSMGVAKIAVRLAERFGVDKEKARIAGLLHDCAREFPNRFMLDEAARRKIPIGDVERAMPLLLHAPVGAYRAREIYGVEDPEILQAILRHTVGGRGMTQLDKIIYISDMIEPNRDYPEVERLRKLSEEAELDDMVLAGLTESIQFVLEKNHLIHPDTVIARNEILLNKM